MTAEQTKPIRDFYSAYLKASEEEDSYLPRSWEANTTGILTFTGLFAAVVATFIIESYKSLSPDSGQETVMLLRELIAITTNVSAGLPTRVASPEPFQVTSTAIVANALWFASLLLALFAALLSTLVQEWSREYARDISRRRSLDDSTKHRAFNHIYVRMGIDKYGMDTVVYKVTALVHLSVALFAGGLLVFLIPIDAIVGSITTAIFGIVTLLYVIVSALPLLDTSCPYRTPVTYLMVDVYWLYLQSLFYVHVAYSRWTTSQDHGPLPIITQLRRSKESSSHAFGNTWHDNMARSVTDYQENEFLTFARFAFMWDRTTRYMIGANRFGDLLDCVANLMSLHARRTFFGNQWDVWQRHVEYIYTDDIFLYGLYRYLDGAYRGDRRETGNLTGFTIVYRLSVIIIDVVEGRRQLLVPAKANSLARTLMRLLSLIADIPRHELSLSEDTFSNWAHLCLRSIHQTLVKSLVHNSLPSANFGKIADQVSRSYFLKHAVEECQPAGILLLMHFHISPLNPGVYPSRWDISDYDGWIKRIQDGPISSGLVPLHDHECCQFTLDMFTPRGLEHNAASNILTSISYLLKAASEARPDKAGLALYTRLLHEGECYYQGIEKQMPSAEFIDIIRGAGFDSWVENGGPTEEIPNNARFRVLRTAGEIAAKRIVSALSNLAECVDWDAYYQQQQGTNPKTTNFFQERIRAATIPVTGLSGDHHASAKQNGSKVCIEAGDTDKQAFCSVYWFSDWPEDTVR
ncbi:hypothetical protein PENSPDRAFT_684591 [Peniophora sp. CONT]|nr:hypothetical protein PENSPDRAFT_684591 [Peniophora sp. CONT]